MQLLEGIGERAQMSLRGVRVFVSQVRRIGKGGRMSVKKLKWLVQKGRLEELNGQLDELYDSANVVFHLIDL